METAKKIAIQVCLWLWVTVLYVTVYVARGFSALFGYLEKGCAWLDARALKAFTDATSALK